MRRKAAMPPIVTVIIVIAAVVAAALAAYFIYSTTARGVRQVSLTVLGSPVLYGDGNLYVTFKNDGTAPVDLKDSTIVVQGKTQTYTCTLTRGTTLNPGDSGSFTYSCGAAAFGDVPDGALATLQAGAYQTSFAIAKP